MSPYKVPDHIWHVILPYSDTPRPAPLSRPQRSALRKPALCALARTSRLFHTIVEPLLYQEVLTDALPLLVSSINPARPSTYRRFRNTSKLFIEYAPTGWDLPYHYIVEDKERVFWEMCGRMPANEESTHAFDCGVELEELLPAVDVLNQLGMARLFPKLVSVSVGSVYGKEDQRWYIFSEAFAMDNAAPVAVCAARFTTFLSSGNLRYICQRNSNGPLGVCTDGPGTKPLPFHLSLHFSPPVDILEAPLGVKTRWVSEYSPESDMSEIIQDTAQSLHAMEDKRRSAEARACSSRSIDLTIFGSANYLSRPEAEIEGVGADMPKIQRVPDEIQRRLVQDLGEQQQKKFRRAGGPRDTVKWFPGRSTPICECCQSGVPGDEEGVWLTGPYAAQE